MHALGGLAHDLVPISTGLLSIPASLGLILASEEIVNGLFGYGSFTSEDVKITSHALKFFGYGVVAFALIKILSNFIQSMIVTILMLTHQKQHLSLRDFLLVML